MVRQPFQIEHLRALRFQSVKDRRFARPCIAVEQHETMRQSILIEHSNDLAAITAVATLQHIRAPANLRQDRRETARTLAPAPTIDQRLPATLFVSQLRLDVLRSVTRDDCSAKLAGEKRALLHVDRADLGTFFIAHHREVNRARHMILCELCGRAHVDHRIKR